MKKCIQFHVLFGKIFLVFLSLSAAAVEGRRKGEPSKTESASHTQFVLFTERLSWNDAHAHCVSEGGTLAFLDQDSNTFLDTEVSTQAFKDKVNDQFWIGIFDSDEANTQKDNSGYSWAANCQTLEGSLTSWAGREPTGDLFCVVMEKDKAVWRSDQCSKENPFLCSWQTSAGTCTSGTSCYSLDISTTLVKPFGLANDKPEVTCPNISTSTSTGGGTSTDFFLFTKMMTWNDAHAHCVSEGMTLAFVDEDSSTFIEQRMADTDFKNTIFEPFWIGIFDSVIADVSKNDAGYSWSATCQTLEGSWTNWKRGEPKNPESSFCVVMDTDKPNLGTDTCSIERSFLCSRLSPASCPTDIACFSLTLDSSDMVGAGSSSNTPELTCQPPATSLSTGMKKELESASLTKFVLFTERLSWNDAHAHCVSQGGTLAFLDQDSNTFLEHEMLTDVFKNKVADNFWIGIFDSDASDKSLSASSYSWAANCQTLEGSWTSWMSGEPQNTNDHFCVVIEKDKSVWRGDKCSEYRPFLCSWQTSAGTCLSGTSCYSLNITATPVSPIGLTNDKPEVTCPTVSTSASTVNEATTGTTSDSEQTSDTITVNEATTSIPFMTNTATKVTTSVASASMTEVTSPGITQTPNGTRTSPMTNAPTPPNSVTNVPETSRPLDTTVSSTEREDSPNSTAPNPMQDAATVNNASQGGNNTNPNENNNGANSSSPGTITTNAGTNNTIPGTDNTSPSGNNPNPGTNTGTDNTNSVGTDNTNPGTNNTDPVTNNTIPGTDNTSPSGNNPNPGTNPGIDNTNPIGADNTNPGTKNTNPVMDNTNPVGTNNTDPVTNNTIPGTDNTSPSGNNPNPGTNSGANNTMQDNASVRSTTDSTKDSNGKTGETAGMTLSTEPTQLAPTPKPSAKRSLSLPKQCKCVRNQPLRNITLMTSQAGNVTRAIKEALSVDVTGLSSSRRKKESAKDSRPSTQQIGYGWGIAVGIFFAVVVVLDLPYMYRNARYGKFD